MPITVGVSLGEDPSRGVFGGVGGNGEGAREDGKLEDGLGEEQFLESIKGSLMEGGPRPWLILLSEI